MQDAAKNAKRTKTRLVLVLSMLSLLLAQMRAAHDRPQHKFALLRGYVRPGRPSLFVIKRGDLRLSPEVESNGTTGGTLLEMRPPLPLPGGLMQDFIQSDAAM